MSLYKVGVQIAMTGNVTQFLGVMMRDVLGINGHLTQMTSGLTRVRAALVGAGAVMTGGAMFVGMDKLVDKAGVLTHSLTQIKKLGLDPQQYNEAQKAIYALHDKVPGVTSVDAAQIYGSTYSMFGHENSMKVMQPLAEFAQVVGNTTHDWEGAFSSLYAQVRSGDLMGKFMNEKTHQIDTSNLTHFLDIGAKVIAATHGKVNANTWYGLAQQGGPALAGMSDTGLITMAIAAQAMGGPRAGTALTSMYQQMIGGKMTAAVAEILSDEYHLLGHYKIKRGGAVKWDAGALDTPLGAALKTDPMQAVQILQKAMEAHGLNTLDKQVPQLFQMLGRQTTQRLVHDLLRNMPQIMQERSRIAAGLDVKTDTNIQNAEDYEQLQHNYHAAMDEAAMHAGMALMPMAISAIKELTSLFDAIGDFAKSHPGTMHEIAIGFVGLATGLTALGTVLIGGAILAAIGTGGWLVVGLVALGGAFAALRAEMAPVRDKGMPDAAGPLYKGNGDRSDTPAVTFDSVMRQDIMRDPAAFANNFGKLMSQWGDQFAGAFPNFMTRVRFAVPQFAHDMTTVADTVVSAISSGAAHLAKLPTGVMSLIKGIWDSIDIGHAVTPEMWARESQGVKEFLRGFRTVLDSMTLGITGTVSAAFAGMFTSAIVSVKAALGSFKDSYMQSWNAMKAAFGITPDLSFTQAIKAAFAQVGADMKNAIESIPGMVAGAIAGMASSIGHAISNAIPSAHSIMNYLTGHKDAPTSGPATPGKQGMNETSPSTASHSKTAMYVGPSSATAKPQIVAANVYLSGKKVGDVVLSSVARNSNSIGSVSHFDTSAHPDFASA